MVMYFISLVSANYSIDISGLKESYSIGEKINYNVLLLQDGKPITDNVDVIFSDDFGNNKIKLNVVSNNPNELLINESFSSKGWHVTANYSERKVTNSFFILEYSEVEFVIEGNKLIIKNKGNVRYTKDVKVKIGEEVNTYIQNIPVGDEKVWVLIAPKGSYSIEITDGVNTFTKNNVVLNSVGTGNAIGAMGESMGISGFSSAPIDPENMDKSFISNKGAPIAMLFIIGVLILGILLFIERKLRK